jgi:hypothetical protein
MDEIIRFVMLARSARFTVSELCEQFGISRKTGYKHLERYAADGLKGLAVRSHRPHQFPQRTDAAVEALILAERRLHRTWGPKKLHKVNVNGSVLDNDILAAVFPSGACFVQLPIDSAGSRQNSPKETDSQSDGPCDNSPRPCHVELLQFDSPTRGSQHGSTSTSRPRARFLHHSLVRFLSDLEPSNHPRNQSAYD